MTLWKIEFDGKTRIWIDPDDYSLEMIREMAQCHFQVDVLIIKVTPEPVFGTIKSGVKFLRPITQLTIEYPVSVS